MKLQFCGAARTVTGSCYFLDLGYAKVLVDCGAFQGSDELDQLNRDDFPFDPAEIDYLFLTHAHFDHCGRVPILVRKGFKGRIIATQPTRDLAEIVLMDAASLQEEEYRRWLAREKRDEEKGDAKKGGGNRTNASQYQYAQIKSDYELNGRLPEGYASNAVIPKPDGTWTNSEEGSLYENKEPLFTVEDVTRMMGLFDIYPFGNSVVLQDGLEFRMRDSGHILGSAMFEIWAKNDAGKLKKFLFSGDLGQQGQRIVRDPDMIREADYVLIESTYGNRLHKSKDETVKEFLSVILTAQKDGGNILIPTFAIERAQEIIYELNLSYENKLIQNLPVYLDSPMAAKATEVFRKHPTFYDEDARRLLEKGDDPFEFKELQITESAEDSKRLVGQTGIMILAGSGMCTGGRIVHHLANNIEKKNTHIVFVGYQVTGTLGRRIVDGEPIVRIKGKEMEVKAKVHTLGGFSAHADSRDLRYWLRGLGHTPKTVFIVHGEESISMAFAANVREELELNAYVPFLNEIVELD